MPQPARPVPPILFVGKIFCLAEAPSAEAARAVHREAHGLVADEVYGVSEGS